MRFRFSWMSMRPLSLLSTTPPATSLSARASFWMNTPPSRSARKVETSVSRCVGTGLLMVILLLLLLLVISGQRAGCGRCRRWVWAPSVWRWRVAPDRPCAGRCHKALAVQSAQIVCHLLHGLGADEFVQAGAGGHQEGEQLQGLAHQGWVQVLEVLKVQRVVVAVPKGQQEVACVAGIAVGSIAGRVVQLNQGAFDIVGAGFECDHDVVLRVLGYPPHATEGAGE